MKRIAIIGHFGGKESFFDGQTIKTKVLYRELNKTDENKIYKIDTYYKRRNPLKLIWQTFCGIVSHKDIFILLSRGGMKIYLPLLYFAGKLKRLNVYHDVIGGNLDYYVRNNPKYLKYLNSFAVNWVETESLRAKLEELGVNNAEVLPNFKHLESVEATQYEDEVFRFCTFSRVMKEKGIETAVNAVNRLNAEYGKTVCSLDIYGAVDSGYADDFKRLSEGFGENVRYCGIVPFDQSVPTLKKYYALLFPTYWDGEGFPGTVLDAYASAIPVVASDWNYNGEIIKHMRSGILYPNEEFSDLYEAMKWTTEHRDEMNRMRQSCESEYLKYKPETLMKQVYEKLQ